MSKLIDALACKGLPARDIRNANFVNLWALAWAVTLGLASYLSDYPWYASTIPTMVGFVVHTSIGIGMIFAYRRFLRELDELERKIQLDALAGAVGVTIVGFSAYSILEKAGYVPELGPSNLIILIAVTYMVGVIIGRVRYQ
jgi:amino acid transporter